MQEERSNEKVTWCKNDHLSCSRFSDRFIRQEWETQCNDRSLGRNMLFFPTLCNRITEKGHIYLWPVSYTHLRAHETRHDLVCRLLLEKKKNIMTKRIGPV